MLALSFICALILSLIASALREPKELAKELDRSRQMLIAAKLLSHDGYFLLKDKEGKYIPAKYENEKFIPGTEQDIATNQEVLNVYKSLFIPLLVDKEGNVKTFEQAGIDLNKYVAEYKTVGYYKLPLMLIYKMLPQNYELKQKSVLEAPTAGWVVPISGFGLWDAIYGYLALQSDGDTVIGITWYEQKETPGLGGDMSEESWQKQFAGKKIFLSSSDEENFQTVPLGITVVKGTVQEVLGNTPRAKSAVDGMSGATLTGNGITQAYKDNLAPYRPFLIRIHKESLSGKETQGENQQE